MNIIALNFIVCAYTNKSDDDDDDDDDYKQR